MTETMLLPFNLPAVERKKVSGAFDGGRLSSDGGVMLLALAARKLGIAERLAKLFPDDREQSCIDHSIASMIQTKPG